MMRVQAQPPARCGFSLVEILVSIAIVAVLIGLLLPMLSHARDVSRTTLCASNLRQIGMAWQAYFHEFDQFPRHTEQPDWRYGGVMFVGVDRRAVLDLERPINRPLAEQGLGESGELAGLFRCPGDKGVFARDDGDPRGRVSVLAGKTCFGTFGTSYRANLFLLDSTRAGIDPSRRPPAHRRRRLVVRHATRPRSRRLARSQLAHQARRREHARHRRLRPFHRLRR